MFTKVKTSKSGLPPFQLARWLWIFLGLFLWGNSGTALTVLTNDTTTTPTPIIYLGTTPDSQQMLLLEQRKQPNGWTV